MNLFSSEESFSSLTINKKAAIILSTSVPSSSSDGQASLIKGDYAGKPVKELREMRINKDTIIVQHNLEITDILIEPVYVIEQHLSDDE